MRLTHRWPAALTAAVLILVTSPSISPLAEAAPTTSAAFSKTYPMTVPFGARALAAGAAGRIAAELPDRKATFDLAAITWSKGTLPSKARLQYAVQQLNGQWTPWTSVNAPDPDVAQGAREGTDPIYTGPAKAFRARILSSGRVGQPQVTLIASSGIPSRATGATTSASGPAEPLSARATATGGAATDDVYAANGGTFGATTTSTGPSPITFRRREPRGLGR